MSRVKILIPKNVSTSCIIAKTEKSTTIPIKADVILPRADSIPALSPPEDIHWIAPIISIKKNIIFPTTKASEIKAGNKACKNTTPGFVSELKKFDKELPTPKAGLVIRGFGTKFGFDI